MSERKGEIFIYEGEDGHTSVEVSLERGTIWLTQQQISILFGTKRPAITKHLNNIFISKELEEESVCSILEHTAADGKRYKTRFYNLDAVLSVGYRVNSKSATAFRIWANQILKEYLVKGYVHNEKLLMEKQEQLESLKKTVALIASITNSQALSGDQATGLLRVLSDYAYALDVLDKYDHQLLVIEAVSPSAIFQITYSSAIEAIYSLKDKFGGSTLFGNEKDESFQGSLAAIYQTFGGADLYPSVEEKAANLLYFVIKNHSFSDGNKRIAAFLFVWFLEKNAILYHFDGSRKLADNALVALTLMIAESKPEEKEVMTKVVVSLINRKN